MRDDVFPSKVDSWLAIVLTLSSVFSLAVSASMLTSGDARMLLVAAALVLIGAGLPLWLLLRTHYSLTATDLAIVSGPFRWHVPICDIRSVTPTRNPLSSPALSLDRLRIDYGTKKWLMISPRDKDGFLKALERRRSAS